jgi:hypothetical protein
MGSPERKNGHDSFRTLRTGIRIRSAMTKDCLEDAVRNGYSPFELDAKSRINQNPR